MSCISLENIAYQNDNPFITELTEAIDSYMRKPVLTQKGFDESRIGEIVNKRFNTSFKFELDLKDEVGAAIVLDYASKNHPFYSALKVKLKESDTIVKMLGESGEKLGKVDMQKLKMYGIYSKITPTILLSAFIFSPSRLPGTEALTAREIAAYILHEVGHYFTYCIYLHNTTMCTFVSNWSATKAMGAKGDMERKMVLKDGCNGIGLKETDVESMLSNTAEQNAVTMQSIYLEKQRDKVRMESGLGLYEFRQEEQLADLFPSRFGLSYDLASALAKDTPAKWYIDKGKGDHIAGQAIIVAANIVLLCFIGSIITSIGTALAMLPVGLLTFGLPVISGRFVDIGDYDRPAERFKTLRNYAIMNLKDSDKASKAYKATLIKEIDMLEELMGKYHNRINIYQWLAQKTWSRTARKAKSERDYQKQIEGLLYNDIFVTAAKFDQLT